MDDDNKMHKSNTNFSLTIVEHIVG